MKRLLLPFAMVLCSAAFGQKALTNYFPAGITNADVLIESYVTPLAEDLGTLANNGWYNTGATHKRFGFDISLTMNSVFLSSGRKYIDPPSTSGTTFSGTVTPSGVIDKVPTIYGKKAEYPNFINTTGPNMVPFRGPDGIDPQKSYGINGQILPTVQVGVGLFANTDLRLRFTPQQTINGIKSGTMGGALMHDIKQHIPGLKLAPFSMSLLLGYTKLDGKVDLSGRYTGTGQEGKISSTATTAQLLVSKSLAIITFYLGLGINSATTKFDVKGSYLVDEYTIAVVGGTASLPSPFTLTNPYKYSFKTSGFKATIGTRLKLGPFFLNGDYSFFKSQKLLTVGSGFTFR